MKIQKIMKKKWNEVIVRPCDNSLVSNSWNNNTYIKTKIIEEFISIGNDETNEKMFYVRWKIMNISAIPVNVLIMFETFKWNLSHT